MKNLTGKHSIWASFGGAFTGLCCAGSPIVLAFLTGAGLGFIINDFILFPLLFISLWFMYKSLRYNKKNHLSPNPLYVGIISVFILFIGILFRPIIWLGVFGLFIATIWDFILLRKNKNEKPN